MEGEWTFELERAITLQHIRLSRYSRQEAVDEFLKILADQPAYGVETHPLDPAKNAGRIALGVGMNAICAFNRSGQVDLR